MKNPMQSPKMQRPARDTFFHSSAAQQLDSVTLPEEQVFGLANELRRYAPNAVRDAAKTALDAAKGFNETWGTALDSYIQGVESKRLLPPREHARGIRQLKLLKQATQEARKGQPVEGLEALEAWVGEKMGALQRYGSAAEGKAGKRLLAALHQGMTFEALHELGPDGVAMALEDMSSGTAAMLGIVPDLWDELDGMED